MTDYTIEVVEYLTEDGRSPYREWLSTLRDREARVRVRVRIDRMMLGNFGDSQSVGKGVSEIRVPHGPGYRVYFGRDGSKLVILLCGGDKRTQSADIDQARAYWADYQRRKTWVK